MSVLILADEQDFTADAMVRAVQARGVEVHRLNLGWFPAQLSITAELRGSAWIGKLHTPYRDVALEDIQAVWYRSPTGFQIPGELSMQERRHCYTEAKLGIGGVLMSLPVLWVNHPGRQALAEYKPLQLATAARCGLQTPATLVTSEAASIRDFADRTGNVVTKAFGANSIIEDGTTKTAFTRMVTSEDLADLRGVELTAHQFQAAAAPKLFDARVVVAGRQQFGVAIHGEYLDFRAGYGSHRYERVDIPPQVADGITGVMEAFGLVYAAIDFVVTTAQEWLFIGDLNPAGQYGWLEETTGAPITDALADLLVKGGETG